MRLGICGFRVLAPGVAIDKRSSESEQSKAYSVERNDAASTGPVVLPQPEDNSTQLRITHHEHCIASPHQRYKKIHHPVVAQHYQLFSIQ